MGRPRAHRGGFRRRPGSSAIADETVTFEFPSVEEAVERYAADFGPFVAARTVLEPQRRWDEFLGAFGDLVRRFNPASDGSAQIPSKYFVITVDR